MKIEEKGSKIRVSDLIGPEKLDEFQQELSHLLQKMYMQGYEKGYKDAKQFALNYLNNDTP